MRYAGTMLCHACTEGDHKACAPFDLIDERTGTYATCSCPCQEARECAAYDEERGARMRAQFHADLEWIFGGRTGP